MNQFDRNQFEAIMYYANCFSKSGLVNMEYLAEEAAKAIGLDPSKAVFKFKENDEKANDSNVWQDPIR